jgi:hypothetical protein
MSEKSPTLIYALRSPETALGEAGRKGGPRRRSVRRQDPATIAAPTATPFLHLLHFAARSCACYPSSRRRESEQTFSIHNFFRPASPSIHSTCLHPTAKPLDILCDNEAVSFFHGLRQNRQFGPIGPVKNA